MQMVKNILIAALLIWFALLLFMPKKALYYKLEEILAKSEVKINEERIDEGLFSLSIQKPKVFVKGIQIATLEKIDVFTVLFFTKLKLDTLKLDESLKAMAPTDIERITASHSVLNPMHIQVDAVGEFGDVAGKVDMKNRTLRMDFNGTSALKTLKPKLKQDEKGWYYETSF
jgi:hypothetical protein